MARVDPAREGDTLVARRVGVEPQRPAARQAVVEAVAEALREAAEWVGCSAVRVERVTPEEFAAPLRAAVGRA